MNSPVILITGGARRIGAEISRSLHAAGGTVAVHFNSSNTNADNLVAELGALRAGSAAAFQADLLDDIALAELVAKVVEKFGRLDGLVNNASSFFPTKIGTTTAAQWDNLVGTNFRAPLFLAQAAAPHLAARQGCIVNITDIHAERPLKGYPVYCAAKAGLLGLTRALAVELAPQVRVNAVAPGAVMWPENSELVSAGAAEVTQDFPLAQQAAIIRHTLLNRIGSPTDIAKTVKFLIFDAPYITGQIINVDGGRSAHL